VKSSGRNEPMCVAVYKCIETMLRISLFSYLYPKLAKTICLSYYLLCFLFNKIRKEGRTGSAWKQGLGVVEGWGEVARTMYTHVSKCRNDKIKGEREKVNNDARFK
jgi:hypothetical protein